MPDTDSIARLPLDPIAPVPSQVQGGHAVGVPVPPTRFVGRDGEADAIAALLRRDGVRLVTLIGPGGVGKTRLALRVAEGLAEEYPGGIAFVPLAPVDDPDLVAPAIAAAVGLREEGGGPVAETLAATLRDRRLLLILDNFEQVVEAAPLVADLVRVCPRLSVLVTSRAPLRVSGEHEVAVEPLTVPNPGDLPAWLYDADAVRLFVERARAAGARFGLGDEHAAAVAEICRRLDGLPLAIELAAAKTRLLPPPALLARLGQRLPMLSGGPRDAPDRHRTMRDAVAWSHDLLSAEDQALFRRLAVFAGGFTLDAAQAVAVHPNGRAADIFAGVEALAGQSLVRRLDVVAGEPRFGMLETIREFGLERLAGSGEEAELRGRHAAWCVGLAEAAGRGFDAGRGAAGWLARLDVEVPNLLAALGWLLETGDAESVLRLVGSTDDYWIETGRPYVAQVRPWLETALATASHEPSAILATALHVAVLMATHMGDVPGGIARSEDGLAVGRALGDPFIIGRAHFDRGVVWEFAGDADRAAAEYAEAVPYLREAGPLTYTAMAIGFLGDMRLSAGDAAAAIPLLDEALALHRQAGYERGIAVALGQRAYAARALDDHLLATRLFNDSFAAASENGLERIALGAVAGLAGVALSLGDPARAARLLGAVQAARSAKGIGPPAHNFHVVGIVAVARAALGRAAFAAAWDVGRALRFEEALADARAVSPRPAVRARDPFDLTPREREVLRLLVRRRTDKEIADSLFVSPRTVGTHVTRVLGKLGVRNRRDAAAVALELGIV